MSRCGPVESSSRGESVLQSSLFMGIKADV